MKKHLILFVFLLGAISGIFAQTINVQLSGTVLRDSTNAPVPNHEVIIQADSNGYGFNYYATRYTDTNGYYDCYIHNVPAQGIAVTFVVKTKNCDSTFLTQTFVATATPVTVNFLLCNNNTTGCEAGFHAVPDSSSSYTVNFYDYSTAGSGYIVAWHWDFGDGTSTTVSYPANPNVEHTYANAGTYTVCLTIETSTNCVNQVCHEVTVGQNTECHALYHFQADSVNVTHVHFWDVSTPQNLVTSRFWDFGDPASGLNNNSTTMDPWHIFSGPGKYNVCLTISTSLGCTSTKCDSITVGSYTNCENWITYTCSGLTFNFEGHTQSPYPTTYTWSFGDGGTATGQVVQHTYATGGNYTITLHTVDSLNCEWSRTQTIYAHATCTLYGTAYLVANATPVDHGLAELIRVESGAVTIVDSVEIGDSAGMYWFHEVLPGHYYIRASLLPSSAYYGQYVPTYHFDAVNWANAILIGLGEPNNPYNIHMHHVNSYTSGNGNISGTITQNGKYNGSGTPAPDVEVLLLDASDQLLDFTMTNADGEFSFPLIAMGTYKIYPEILGKTTTPSSVTLDASHTNATVEFAVNGNNISGIQNENLPVDFAVSDIFPNPVTDYAGLTINTVHASGITIGIFSITGQAVREIPVALHPGINKVNLPVADLMKGLYYVKIGKPDGGIAVKKFILNK